MDYNGVNQTLPVKDSLEKGDIIWVKDNNKWIRRTFVKFNDFGEPMCYVQHGLNIYYNEALTSYKEYSIYKPI